MYREIEEKANMDRRTGLYNHSYFENVLETELNISRSQNTPLSLALIDIDDFKKYNDHFGHLKGDQLLGFLGEILKKGNFRLQYYRLPLWRRRIHAAYA